MIWRRMTPDNNASVQRQWQPATTRVFAVGVLAYPTGQAWPEEGRRDAEMIAVLRDRGVPAEQITFITNQRATLAAVRASFTAFLADAPVDSTLWFYFAGHGTKRDSGVVDFALYDGKWPIPEVFSTIERGFSGRTALLFADCCYSGALGAEAMLRAGRVSYGVIASSLASTASTGAWTFTECLIAGLRGMVPLGADGDGSVTFGKLARFAEREMAFNDGQLSTFVATNGFDSGLVLAAGTTRADPPIGDYVEAKWTDGRWYRGRIERVDSGRFWIRWAGYHDSENAWIEQANVRPFEPPQHSPGTRVRVEWQGAWYPAQVLTARWGLHLVHYDDFEPVWDEWVSFDRIRLR
jgi:hypothetical protein